MQQSLPHYALEYDEELDAICSLELLAEHLPRVVSVPHHWKWVILALHSALQGFMVLALQGTNALAVLKKESAEHWSEAYEHGLPPTRPMELDAFMALYRKIKSDEMKILTNSEVFAPNSTQDDNVRRLNAIRNDFVHFVPSTSVFGLREWADMVTDTIAIVAFLANQSNNVNFHEEGTPERVRALCGLVQRDAEALRSYYGA